MGAVAGTGFEPVSSAYETELGAISSLTRDVLAICHQFSVLIDSIAPSRHFVIFLLFLIFTPGKLARVR